jgi:hypothetical protein
MGFSVAQILENTLYFLALINPAAKSFSCRPLIPHWIPADFRIKLEIQSGGVADAGGIFAVRQVILRIFST